MKIEVKTMSCNHCKMTIEKILKEAGVSKYEVDLDRKLVLVESNEVSEGAIKELIRAKGYEVV